MMMIGWANPDAPFEVKSFLGGKVPELRAKGYAPSLT